MGAVGHLLDTHTFLWAVWEDLNLSGDVRNVVNGESAAIFVSIVADSYVVI